MRQQLQKNFTRAESLAPPRLRVIGLASPAIVGLAIAAGLLLSGRAVADPGFGSGFLQRQGFGNGDGSQSAGDLAVHASILPADQNHPARLSIAVDVPDGWHIYSITQPPGGPYRTKIKLDQSDEFRLDGDFSADPAPHVHMDDAFPGLPQEEQSGHVVWTAPLVFRQGVDLSRLKISGAVNAQRCSTSCLAPKDFKFTAMLATSSQANGGAPAASSGQSPTTLGGSQSRHLPEPIRDMAKDGAAGDSTNWSVGKYQAAGSDAIVEGWIEPSKVAPGNTAQLILSITPGPGAHVYALAPHDTSAAGTGKPTLIDVQKIPQWTIDAPSADRAPTDENSDSGPESVYEQPIRWTVNIVPRASATGTYTIEGLIGYQTCTKQNCTAPTAARFKGQITIGPNGSSTGSDVQSLSFAPASYRTVAQSIVKNPPETSAGQDATARQTSEISGASALLAQLRPRIKGARPTTLLTVILFGLVGGLILNLMPCVLPVIGLKILGFVEQAGQSRGRTLMLNLWYSLGLLSVFMVLAALAANLQLKWGQQFQSATFVIVMSGVVFVMALSFLGVWEIPIPGFVGSGRSAELAAREGAIGAFSKGVLTTILATPCSGPYLGAVFSYALTQSALLTYVVFASIGLGMASPYLLIGAFPSLVKFLPKPGAWMETFKQFMGFVLLGTAVYLLSLLDKNLLVPVLVLMVGLALGCWWIGRTPLTADLDRKVTAWISGAGIAAAVGWFALTVLVPHPDQPHAARLDWQPYSIAKLDKLLSQRKTVMVDFTANWCPTCQFNLLNAINTQAVKRAVTKNGIVALTADFSDSSPESDRLLAALGYQTIPVLAIFPADHPNEPIVLPDLISQGEIIETIDEAGPSRPGLASIDSQSR